jgi:hypothetical protein
MKNCIAQRVNEAATALWDASTGLNELVQRLSVPERVGDIVELFDVDAKRQKIGEQHVTDRVDEVFMIQFHDTSVLIGTDHSVIVVVEPVSW